MPHIIFFQWPVTKVGMWNFKWNRFEVSGIWVHSCKDFWQSALLYGSASQCMQSV